MTLSNCNGCTRRVVGCHEECPQYKEEVEYREMLAEKKRDAHENDYVSLACQKSVKRIMMNKKERGR